MAGTVHQINVSPGGVPKRPISQALISSSGVEGDDQADKIHHGSPDQAVCLFSLEVIEGLQAEGHPIFPGAAGENLTLAGLDWSQVKPGAVLRVGGALLEITYFATPCAKNAQWFVDRDFNRMHHDRHPGWSRTYARVLEPGLVRNGHPAEIIEGEP